MTDSVGEIWSRIAVQESKGLPHGKNQHRVAVAALLFKVMPVDGEIHSSERVRLGRILADEFAISEDEVDALVTQVQSDAEDARDISEISDHLKDTLAHADKLVLISHMWEMVFADGRLHESEVLLVERVACLLGVAPEEVSAMMNVQHESLTGKLQ